MKVQCNIRVDKEIKDNAKPILEKLGLSLSTYINLCLHQLVLQEGIPFGVTAREAKTVEKPTLTLSDVKDKAETVEKDLSPTEEKGKRKSKTAKALAQFDF